MSCILSACCEEQGSHCPLWNSRIKSASWSSSEGEPGLAVIPVASGEAHQPGSSKGFWGNVKVITVIQMGWKSPAVSPPVLPATSHQCGLSKVALPCRAWVSSSLYRHPKAWPTPLRPARPMSLRLPTLLLLQWPPPPPSWLLLSVPSFGQAYSVLAVSVISPASDSSSRIPPSPPLSPLQGEPALAAGPCDWQVELEQVEDLCMCSL